MKRALCVCLLLLIAAGPATQPATQPATNGPKIAKELREEIAKLKSQMAELEAKIAAANAENAELKSRLETALAANVKPDDKQRIADAVRRREIIPGMSKALCDEIAKKQRNPESGFGLKKSEAADGSQVWHYCWNVIVGPGEITKVVWFRVSFNSAMTVTSVESLN